MVDIIRSGRPRTDRQIPDVLPAPPPRLAVPVGAAMLAAVVLIAVLLRDPGSSAIQSVDDSWAGGMPGSSGGALSVLATVVEAGLGGPTGLMAPLGLVGWLLVCRRHWSALYALTTCVLANLVLVLPLKDAVDREHPEDPWTLVSGGSFPSGHAFTAAALVVVLGALVCRQASRRRWWWVGLCFVATVMWSGTWVRDSWLSDTVAGALVGAGTALLLWRAFAPLLRREALGAAAGPG